MKTYRGGERVGQGIYWSLRTLEFVHTPAEGGPLPGGGGARYVRTPALLMLAMGPLLGLTYIVFLPMVGIVGLLAFAVRRVAGLAAQAAEGVAQLVVVEWAPAVSYLVRGHRGGTKEPTAATPMATHAEGDDTLGRLEEELRGRRERGER